MKTEWLMIKLICLLYNMDFVVPPHIFDSFIFSTVTPQMHRVCITLEPCLPLQNDILIKCYHRIHNNISSLRTGRTVLFRLQLHTCAINTSSVVFNMDQLDDIQQGESFRGYREAAAWKLKNKLFIILSTWYIWNTLSTNWQRVSFTKQQKQYMWKHAQRICRS